MSDPVPRCICGHIRNHHWSRTGRCQRKGRDTRCRCKRYREAATPVTNRTEENR